MTEQRFTAVIQKSGAKTGIAIPFNPAEVWGVRQRYHVSGSVGGCPFRGPINSEDGSSFLSLGPAWLRDNHLETGSMVEVVLSLEGPQTEKLEPDIQAALDAEPQARAFFDSLATFYRKNYIRWIAGAKQPETRKKRIAEMVQLLKEGKKQKG